jgi:hypothetical protein
MGEGCHLDPPGGHLSKPEAPVEERHTGSFLRFIRFLRGCLRRLCVHTQFSDSGDDLQDPRHTRVALPIVGKGLSKTPFMSGRVEQRRGAYCYSCLLPSEVFTRRLLRKKRIKRRK